jgi:hypothetical protein
LLTGNERLDDRGRDRMLLGLRVGDPEDEVLGAWLAKESFRDIYLADRSCSARSTPRLPSGGLGGGSSASPLHAAADLVTARA